ncbi:MAG: endonuclease VII domain-containing protein [Candidatus Odinarchaeia archaeon]
MEEQIVMNKTENPGQFKKGYTPWNKGVSKYSDKKEAKRKEYRKNEKKYWERKIKNKFGVTMEEYDKILREQKEKCAICGKKPKMRLSIDHNHKTGKVRGLLCYNCNAGIGMFREDTSLMKKAIKYMEKYNGRKDK